MSNESMSWEHSWIITEHVVWWEAMQTVPFFTPEAWTISIISLETSWNVGIHPLDWSSSSFWNTLNSIIKYPAFVLQRLPFFSEFVLILLAMKQICKNSRNANFCALFHNIIVHAYALQYYSISHLRYKSNIKLKKLFYLKMSCNHNYLNCLNKKAPLVVRMELKIFELDLLLVAYRVATNIWIRSCFSCVPSSNKHLR